MEARDANDPPCHGNDPRVRDRCATTQQARIKELPAVCGFLGASCDLLTPGATGEAGLRYVNSKARFTQYNRMIVEVVGFFGADAAKVPPKDQEALTELFQRSLTEALAKRYQIVDEAGPGVMLVQVAVLDAEAATPGARSISMAVPQVRVLATGGGGGALKTVAQWEWGDAANAITAWSEQMSNGLYAYTSGARTP